MDIRLPLEGAYKSRGDASAEVHLVIGERFGKAVALDKKQSGGRKLHLYVLHPSTNLTRTIAAPTIFITS